MNKRGFTLIELLAVIVILAILTLIAIPVVLNIISDSRDSSNKRSVELYAKALKNAYANYEMNNNGVPSSFSDIEPYIEVDNAPKDCKNKIYPNGSIYLSCNIDGKEYTYGNLYYCYTNSKGSITNIGTEFNCSLKDDTYRKFYVLDYDENNRFLYLILNENFRNENVPGAMGWCSTPEDCDEPDILNEYIEIIQNLFDDNITVMLPSKEMIEQIPLINGRLPSWLENFNYAYKSIVVEGYWTSSSYSPNIAYTVYRYSYDNSFNLRSSWFFGHKAGSGSIGLRPVIKISLDLVGGF